jgi:N6-adenosine-specific RNA methylase IME4
MNAPAPFDPTDVGGWVARIVARWHDSVAAIIDTGRMLNDAKAALPHGEFQRMCRERLPFDVRTAQRLMRIGEDPRLSNAANMPHLPPAWGTLYELTRLDDESFAARLSDGTIRPDMERKAVSGAVKAIVRERRLATLGTKTRALPRRKFNVIYADPPWRFKTRSENGMDRAADNHYPTMALEDVMALPVADIAAKECVLFMWTTVPFMEHAFAVLKAWGGFQYKSHCIWAKDKPGTGYWFINQHEILMAATLGGIDAPLAGTQMRSVVPAPVKEHSRKPLIFRFEIERQYPHVERIELFCRGKSGDLWSTWGNEDEVEDTLAGEAAARTTRAERRDASLMRAYMDDDNDGVRNAPEGGISVLPGEGDNLDVNTFGGGILRRQA